MLDSLPHPAPSPGAVEMAPARPLFERVRDTFIAPARLAAGLRQAPVWPDALAISVVVAMLLVLAVPTDVFVGFTEGATDRLGRPVEVTSSPEAIGFYGRLLGMMSALVYQPMFALGLAGVLMLTFTVVLRGRAGFTQYLALAAHTLLIPALGGLAMLPVQAIRGTAVQLTPALLLPFVDPHGALGAVLGAVDLFTVWMLVVAGIGASVLNNDRTARDQAVRLLVGGYVVLAVAVALLTR